MLTDLKNVDSEEEVKSEDTTIVIEKEVSSDRLNSILDELASMVSEVMGMDGARSWDADLLLSAMSLLEWYTGELVWAEERVEASSADQEEAKAIFREKLIDIFKGKTSVLRSVGLTLIDESNEEVSTATFGGQGDRLLADLEAFIDRAKSLAELRARQNRGWSKTNSDRLVAISKAFNDAVESLNELLDMDETKAEETIETVEEIEVPNDVVSSEGVDFTALEIHERRMRLLEDIGDE